MRGRLRLTKDIVELEAEVGALWSGRNIGRRMRWDAGAGQSFPVIHSSPFRTGRYLDLMQWGLIVAWKNDTMVVSTTMDCHAKVCEAAPHYDGPWSAVRRCLIPTDCLWHTDNPKPFAMAPADGPLMTLGAIWEQHLSSAGKYLSCFAILITDADEALKKIRRRMPVVIPPEARAQWLGEETTDDGRITKLLAPCTMAA